MKGQSLAQSIHSANQRQERVRSVLEQEKRQNVSEISNLVMGVVGSMSNARISWEPTGKELMARMSAISGVDIDSNWYEKHKTSRAEKLKKHRELLKMEMDGGKSHGHLRGNSQYGNQSMAGADLAQEDRRRSSVKTLAVKR